MKLRGLALVAVVAIGCNDTTVFQPDENLTVAATVAARTAYGFVATLDQTYAWNDWTTPSGVWHIEASNGYFVTGGVEGYGIFTGKAMINLNNGRGTGSGTMHLDLTEPAVGTWDCRYDAKYEGYFSAPVEQARYFSCKGTGGFEGQTMVGTTTNAVGTLEIW